MFSPQKRTTLQTKTTLLIPLRFYLLFVNILMVNFIDLDNIFSVLNVLLSSDQYFKRVNFVVTVLRV